MYFDTDPDHALLMADDGPSVADDYELGICPFCSGSGEGLTDGSVCRVCHGEGEV